MRLRFVPISAVSFNVAASADDWVDTDCSASLGTDVRRVYCFSVTSAGGSSNVGARSHGSAVDNKVWLSFQAVLPSESDAAGHIDFKRDAVVTFTYVAFGYFQIE